MVASIKISEDISIDINLSDFIEEEKAIFKEKEFEKISEEEKISFVKANKLAQHEIDGKDVLYMGHGISLMIFLGLPMTIFCIFSNVYFLLLSLLVMIAGFNLMEKSGSESLHDNIIKKWLQENEDVLKERMFYDKVASKAMLKKVINIYGKQEIVNLLMNKESLTYKDICNYVACMTKKQEQKNKEIRLSEAVTCLIEETA